jgi:hypothetical protein
MAILAVFFFFFFYAYPITLKPVPISFQMFSLCVSVSFRIVPKSEQLQPASVRSLQLRVTTFLCVF